MTTGRLTGARVLIAEDEALLGWEMTGMLQDEGADVVGPVSSIGQGLATVSEYRSDLDAAVLDWRLVDGTAKPLAETLAKYAVPFVFFTADEVTLRKQWPRSRVLSKLQAPLVVPCLVGVLAGRRGPIDSDSERLELYREPDKRGVRGDEERDAEGHASGVHREDRRQGGRAS